MRRRPATTEVDRRRVLLSVPWSWPFDPPSGHPIRVVRRSSDWGLPAWRARLLVVRDAGALVRSARGADVVVLATVGMEAALYPFLLRLRRRRPLIVAFDYLAPRSSRAARLAGPGMRLVDRFLVIRSGDVTMLGRRFRVPAERCEFVAWPVRADTLPASTTDGGYVYSAGWAHREWDMVIAALAATGLAARIAPGRVVDVPETARGSIQVVPMPPPAEGRLLTAAARSVVVALADTDLPAGPLVLLDAMAMGKAVVATDVNGNRDYVRDGETGLVVPAGDPEALAAALLRLDSDPILRERLGTAAREEILERCSLDRFWAVLLGPDPGRVLPT